jgi:dephospho-CoA kinase
VKKIMPILVIGITGYTCAGKTELATLLEKKGFARINLGDLTRRIAKEKGLSLERTQTWELFKTLTQNDPCWRVKHILKLIEESGSEKIVLDGIRTLEEARELKKVFGDDFLLVEVRVDEKVRIERAMKRKRDVDISNQSNEAKEKWLKMDHEEREMIDKLRPLVDFIALGEGIKNESHSDSLQ